MPLQFYFLMILVGLLSFGAQMFVQSNYRKYRDIQTDSGLTGYQVARKILDDNGLQHVDVVQSRGGTLSDHYDPAKNIVALSPDNYNNASIAAMAVSAHEVGHAIQYATGYSFIKIRNILLKPTIIASQLSQFMILLGVVFIESMPRLLDAGIIMIAIIALFQIVTLPVEFDASARALKIIKADGLADPSEYDGSKKMLTSAALTYVAAVVGTIMNILYLLAVRNGRRND